MASRRTDGTGTLMERTTQAGHVMWVGQWRAGGRQVKRTIGLKRISGSKTGLTTQQAEKRLRDLIAEHLAAESGVAASPRMTVCELSRCYLSRLEDQGRKESTLEDVASHLRIWIEPLLGDHTLDRVAHEDVADLIAMMRKGHRPTLKRKKPLSPKTIRNVIGTASAMYRYAVRQGWATSNPFAAVDLPAVPRSEEIRHLTPDEVRHLVASIPDGPYKAVDAALVLTGAMTGIREGELIALDVADVDWSRQRIHVRTSITRKRRGTPKTVRSSRSVPMAPEVAAALDARTRDQGDQGLVFADPLSGNAMLPTPLLRRYRTYLEAAGLPVHYRVHDLRHTFGVAMASAGEPLTAIKEWMGHADLKTTQIYARWTPGADEADRIARAFAPVDPRAASGRLANGGAMAPLAAPHRANLSESEKR